MPAFQPSVSQKSKKSIYDILLNNIFSGLASRLFLPLQIFCSNFLEFFPRSLPPILSSNSLPLVSLFRRVRYDV